MSYTIDYTDPLRPTFQIAPNSYNGPGGAQAASTLRLYGRGTLQWGEAVDEDLLRLLENFAGATPPLFPNAGQNWCRQELYWVNTSIAIPTTGLVPSDAIFRYNLNTNVWEDLAVIGITAVDTIPGSGNQGQYIYDTVTETIYRWDSPYQQAVPQWMERVHTKNNGLPSDPPKEELMVYTIDNEWVGLSTTLSASVDKWSDVTLPSVMTSSNLVVKEYDPQQSVSVLESSLPTYDRWTLTSTYDWYRVATIQSSTVSTITVSSSSFNQLDFTNSSGMYIIEIDGQTNPFRSCASFLRTSSTQATFTINPDNFAVAPTIGSTVRVYRSKSFAQPTYLFRFENPANIPTENIGSIYVTGIGPMEWNGTMYVPAITTDPWANKVVGEVFALWPEFATSNPPPTTDPKYRFIKLTAGDAYNSGVLVGETVTGVQPNVTAVGTISMAGSPMNGTSIYLINTMRTFMRPGSTSELQSSQNIWHTHTGATDPAGSHNHVGSTDAAGYHGHAYVHSQLGAFGGLMGNGGAWIGPVTSTTGGSGEHAHSLTLSAAGNHTHNITMAGVGGDEARPRNVGFTYFMRIF